MALTPRANIADTSFHYSSTKNLGGKLKYLQYRDQADKHIPQIDPDGNKIQRWTDVGLGKDHSEIMETLHETETSGYKNNVLARTVVISPAISFMQAIPPERQIEVIQELTETTITNWFVKMDVKQPEYSFVTHIAESDDKRPDGQEKDTEGKQPFLHTHVMLAATSPGIGADRENYRIEKNDIQMLHEAGIEAMEQIWTRELGPEKVQELNQELEAMTREHQQLDAARDLANKTPELSQEEFTKLLEQASPPERDEVSEHFLEQLNQDFQKNLEQRLQDEQRAEIELTMDNQEPEPQEVQQGEIEAIELSSDFVNINEPDQQNQLHEEPQIEYEQPQDNNALEFETSDKLNQETLLQIEEVPTISDEPNFATPEGITKPEQEALNLEQLLEEFKEKTQTAPNQEIKQEAVDLGQILAEIEEEREEIPAPSFNDLSQILAEMEEEPKTAAAKTEINQNTELADLLADMEEEPKAAPTRAEIDQNTELADLLADMEEEPKAAATRAEISQNTELADLLADINQENSLEAHLQELDQEETNPEIDNPQIDDQYPDR